MNWAWKELRSICYEELGKPRWPATSLASRWKPRWPADIIGKSHTYADAMVLTEILRSFSEPIVFEIGTRFGAMSAWCACDRGGDAAYVMTLDPKPWAERTAIWSRFGVLASIASWVGRSPKNVPYCSANVAIVDGVHTKAQCAEDIHMCIKRVRAQRVLVHDRKMPGVAMAIKKYKAEVLNEDSSFAIINT